MYRVALAQHQKRRDEDIGVDTCKEYHYAKGTLLTTLLIPERSPSYLPPDSDSPPL